MQTAILLACIACLCVALVLCWMQPRIRRPETLDARAQCRIVLTGEQQAPILEMPSPFPPPDPEFKR